MVRVGTKACVGKELGRAAVLYEVRLSSAGSEREGHRDSCLPPDTEGLLVFYWKSLPGKYTS